MFKTKYKIFDVLDGTWKEKYLNIEGMEKIINSLIQNLEKELESEWEKQFGKLKLDIKHGNVIKRELQLQNKLKELVNSIKIKLKSKNQWISSEEREKRTKEREVLLENLLETQKKIVHSLKAMVGSELNSFSLGNELKNTKEKILDTKKTITEEELDEVYQIQFELTRLQVELESLKGKQLQSHQEIPPK